MSEKVLPQNVVRAFGVAALALGILAAFAKTPDFSENTRVDVRSLARNVEKEEDHVTALELAQWIKDRHADLRVIDVRSRADFDTYHIPTAEQIDVSQLVDAPFRADETIVLYSDGGAHAAQGWVFLRALGYQHVYFLRGGLYEWLDDVINPTVSANPTDSARKSRAKVETLSRYFGGIPRSGNISKPVAAEVAHARRRGC